MTKDYGIDYTQKRLGSKTERGRIVRCWKCGRKGAMSIGYNNSNFTKESCCTIAHKAEIRHNPILHHSTTDYCAIHPRDIPADDPEVIRYRAAIAKRREEPNR